jgi:hypothetical protein
VSSNWTHPSCEPCYGALAFGREPVRIAEHFREQERCCFCGGPTRDGIYVRADPRLLALCSGPHE